MAYQYWQVLTSFFFCCIFKIKMKTFQANYSRNGILIAILLIIPLLIMTPLFIALAYMNLSEVMLFVAIGAIMIAGIGLVLWIVKRHVMVPCEVSVSDGGINVKLLRHSFLYGMSHYESGWGNIRNISTNYDPQNNKRFYLVSFKSPHKTINLTPNDKITSVEEETELGTELLSYVDQFNSQAAPAMQIHSRGFYDSGWARGLTVITWIAMAAVVIIFIAWPGNLPIWRALAFLAYSAIWLTAFYANRKKSKSY